MTLKNPKDGDGTTLQCRRMTEPCSRGLSSQGKCSSPDHLASQTSFPVFETLSILQATDLYTVIQGWPNEYQVKGNKNLPLSVLLWAQPGIVPDFITSVEHCWLIFNEAFTRALLNLVESCWIPWGPSQHIPTDCQGMYNNSGVWLVYWWFFVCLFCFGRFGLRIIES